VKLSTGLFKRVFGMSGAVRPLRLRFRGFTVSALHV
jgi:hypothetical protein